MTRFADQISEWGRQTDARTTAIYRRSVEILGEEMAKTRQQGGRVPFQTGNLARSLLASTQAMPKTSEKPTAGVSVGLVAATLRLDQTVWIGYQAVYARRMNYGFVGADRLGRIYSQSGNYFLEGAMDQWQQIVGRASYEIQRSVESR